MQPTNSHDQLMSTEQVAKITTLSKATLERLRCTAEGPPFIKLGKGLRARVAYRLSDVTTWLSEQRFNSTSEYRKPRK